MQLKLALPDLVSNSYFPAVAAIDLGMFAAEGLDATLDLIFPVDKAYADMRGGTVDIVAGSAHSAVAAFPGWRGVRLLCAQAQGMYWVLVMRSDLNPQQNDLGVIRGKRIGAAPWVEQGLRGLLTAAGYDLALDDIQIAPVPGAAAPPGGGPVNFGLTAAAALRGGLIDGFWANGMGKEIAVTGGYGSVVLDVRRGDGPSGCFDYTLASIAMRSDTDSAVQQAVVRAIEATHTRLKAEPELALEVARKRFPDAAQPLIVELIRRDLPYYESGISVSNFNAMCDFQRRMGLLDDAPVDPASVLGCG
ncbi:MAG: ABC transporter substrate-binding protein [Sphingomonadaceae bacterium]|nr:ABC transporter substrate-binding protein [Sphingomonadaceae bacterium]